MRDFIIIFLIIYFVLFFCVAVVWRNWLVYRMTGKSALKLGHKKGVERITSFYFRYLPLLVAFVLISYIGWPKFYVQLGPFVGLESFVLKLIGIVFMVLALVWIVIAPNQMGNSWRIGIDQGHVTELVTSGVFKYSRNPIFLGIIVSVVGFFMVLPNAVTLAIVALDIALIQVQVSLEEVYLLEQHGEKYQGYCRKVRRWI